MTGPGVLELQPRFLVTAYLDGDDDAQIQTENFADALEQALAQIKGDGLVIGYAVAQETDQRPAQTPPWPGAGIDENDYSPETP